MELKQVSELQSQIDAESFNRTFMELKPFADFVKLKAAVF